MSTLCCLLFINIGYIVGKLTQASEGKNRNLWRVLSKTQILIFYELWMQEEANGCMWIEAQQFYGLDEFSEAN